MYGGPQDKMNVQTFRFCSCAKKFITGSNLFDEHMKQEWTVDCMKIRMPNSVISQSVLLGIVGIILMITKVTNCNTCYAYAVLFLQLLSSMEWCLCNCLKHVCRFLHSLNIASLCCLVRIK